LQRLVDEWSAAEACMSEDEFDTFRFEWNRNFIQQVRSTVSLSFIQSKKKTVKKPF
jgi:hypothetical protein